MTHTEKNHSPAGRRKAQKQTDKRFLDRPFLAWDGEGVTRDGRHDYIMLSNNHGELLDDVLGLSTVRIFEHVLNSAVAHEGSIHVIYGGGYDFNKWFTDFTEAEVRGVYSSRFFRWRGYLLGWRRGKSLYLGHPDSGRSVTIYDVVSFFQCSFVSACDSYLGSKFLHRDMIVENKAQRSAFRPEDVADIIRYNDAELLNLVALMDELRLRLYRVGLKPSRWDGPGAIASALMRRENVQQYRDVAVPSGPAQAGRHAYAGGRFEVVRFGHVESPAYEYDINSAYPSAMRELPDLSAGEWRFYSDDPGPLPFALYHVRMVADTVDWSIPFPLFRRSANGDISYPQSVDGWYWSPEVDVARQWTELTGATLHVLAAWEWRPASDNRPFAFIEPLYLKRQALKRGGDGAHVGIKLGLNSLYGKLAQQVGWEAGPPLRIPPFHQLEWAGYVTATARSQVLAASLSALDSIIAYETDAVFSAQPLNVVEGSGLGEWEATVFSSLTYIQSGLYFGTLANGAEVAKTRGIDRGSFTRDQALAGLSQAHASDRVGRARLSRFVGAGLALSQNYAKWGTWETVPKEIKLTPQGKRSHEWGCALDDPQSVGETLGVWHETICPRYTGMTQESHEFPVEWVNPNPAMRGALLRETAAEDKASEYE